MKQNTSHATALNNEETRRQQNTNVIVENHNGQYSFTFRNADDHWKFVCGNANGGRITSFQLNGHEILVPKNDSGMFGSTFWTAPEDWGWPPPATIDEDSYNSKVDPQNQSVVLYSAVDPRMNIRISKTFCVDTIHNGIHVDYRIHNESTTPQLYAPWEISRVEKNGLTFYRNGHGTVTGVTRGDIETSSRNGICWYTHSSAMKNDAKLFDSSQDGWIAHTDGTLLLVKRFEPATTIAPNEGEIEIYACPDYVEVEQQGSYLEIPAGAASCWRVSWYLRSVSPDLFVKNRMANENRDALVKLVEAVL